MTSSSNDQRSLDWEDWVWQSFFIITVSKSYNPSKREDVDTISKKIRGCRCFGKDRYKFCESISLFPYSLESFKLLKNHFDYLLQLQAWTVVMEFNRFRLQTFLLIALTTLVCRSTSTSFIGQHLQALNNLNNRCVNLTVDLCSHKHIDKDGLPTGQRSKVTCLNHLLTEFMKDLPFDITFLYKYSILENVLPNCLYVIMFV